MTMTNSSIRGVLVLLTLAFAQVDVAWAAAGWTGAASVDELTPMAKHYYVVRLSDARTPTDCKNKEWYFQDYDTIASDKMFLALLEALTSGARVKVYVTGRCNLDGYSEISSVSVMR
ncbi:MAG: hypothetical protein AMS22_07475 [Thiotrichales bacterium SG8_50]|nr:MAG: hypothetical protein AMS22_07475 [Thiotrichales bacterium SG8_50]